MTVMGVSQTIPRRCPASFGVVLVATSLVLAGCGYNQQNSDKNKMEGGYRWNSLYREDVQTVAVPIFTSKEFRRGLEFRLTEAVQKQLELRAPYKVVAREKADTILEGQITEVRSMTLSKDYRTALPREQMITITVDLVWKDQRNGRILCNRKNLTQSGVYIQNLGEGEVVGSQEAIERFALAIVQELQSDW